MPVTVEWYIQEEAILQYTFTGDWSWNDVFAAMESARQMLPENKQRTDILIHYQSNNNLPKSFLTNLKGIAKRQPEYAGLTVIYGSSHVVQTFVEITRKSYAEVAYRIHWVQTEAEAYALIQRDRQGIQDKQDLQN